jgi:hypothetical protein
VQIERQKSPHQSQHPPRRPRARRPRPRLCRPRWRASANSTAC